MRGARFRQAQGNTILVALVSIATMSFLAGIFIESMTKRSQTSGHSASWHDAALGAESAADVAVAEIRRVMPELNPPPANAWAGWTAWEGDTQVELPTGSSIPSNMQLRYAAPGGSPLIGKLGGKAEVILDAPDSMKSSGRQWLRVRSTGTAVVPGRRQPPLSRLDVRLRRISFLQDWRTGQDLERPSVSRVVEVIVRPVRPFEAAIMSGSSVEMGNEHNVVDSFNSTDAQSSTAGEYDSAKRREGGHVYALGPDFLVAGRIFGDAGTNGGSLEKTSTISGEVTNSFYQPLPWVKAPNWLASLPALAPVGMQTTLVGGENGVPRRYKLSSIGGEVILTPAADTILSPVELWVTGDVTGKVRVRAGVEAKIFVEGHLRVQNGTLMNETRRAGNLQLYGVQPAAGQSRDMEFFLGAAIHAAVYAPGHDLRVHGDGDFMGSLTGRSFRTGQKARIHFDEALRESAGAVIDYRAASWVEEVL